MVCTIENIVTICFNQAIDEFYDEWGKQNKKIETIHVQDDFRNSQNIMQIF